MLEILHREQCRRALARGRREDRRIGEDESLFVEEVTDRVDDLVADTQDRRLALGTNPQVAPVHQEINAVFLGRDGVVVRLVHHLEGARDQLVATRRALVGAHRAGDDDGALLAQVIGFGEGRFVDVLLAHHHLQEAGAVADYQEVNLAAGSPVMQPALDGD